MAQLTYPLEQPVGYEGGFADARSSHLAASRLATLTIPVGRVVAPATGDNLCKLPTSAAEVADALGVSVRLAGKAQNSSGVFQYLDGDAVAIAVRGPIWVISETNVAIGDDVFVRYAGVGDLGAVRNATVLNEAAQFPGAKFMTAGTAGTLVQIGFLTVA